VALGKENKKMLSHLNLRINEELLAIPGKDKDDIIIGDKSNDSILA